MISKLVSSQLARSRQAIECTMAKQQLIRQLAILPHFKSLKKLN